MATFLVVVRVLFKLLPMVIQFYREEQQKGIGREEMVDAIVERFQNVRDRAKKARDDARADIATNGGEVPDNKFLRD